MGFCFILGPPVSNTLHCPWPKATAFKECQSQDLRCQDMLRVFMPSFVMANFLGYGQSTWLMWSQGKCLASPTF